MGFDGVLGVFVDKEHKVEDMAVVCGREQGTRARKSEYIRTGDRSDNSDQCRLNGLEVRYLLWALIYSTARDPGFESRLGPFFIFASIQETLIIAPWHHTRSTLQQCNQKAVIPQPLNQLT